jgi:hypothetical protein
MEVNQIFIQTKQKRLARCTLLTNIERNQQAIILQQIAQVPAKISITAFNRKRNKQLTKKEYFIDGEIELYRNSTVRTCNKGHM